MKYRCVCMCMYACIYVILVSKSRSPHRGEIISFNNALRNQGTMVGYSGYQKNFIEYCLKNNFDYTTPNVDYVCKYLMHKFFEAKWTSGSTFNQARSAISDMYRYSFNTRIGDSDLVCATINNISQHCRQPTQKNPLTREIIARICAVINVNNREQVRNYYMMILMMAGFFREAEIVSLEMSRVKILYNHNNVGVGLEVEHTPFKKKKKEYIKKYISSAPSNLVMDVLTWHKCYMKYVNESSSFYLFHDVRSGAALSPKTPWHVFKSLFQLAGLDFRLYGSHSARRGGATAAFEAGVSVEMIKQHGSWQSNAVERYLRPSQEVQLSTTSFLNNNTQQHNTTNQSSIN